MTRADEVQLDLTDLGSRLEAARRRRGLSQLQLADTSGISRVQIQNLEAGTTRRDAMSPPNPTLKTLVNLCVALDINFRIEPGSDGVRIVIEDLPHPT